MFEVACERQRILASGGIAGQVNAFVIIQNLFAIGEMEIVTRHGGSRVLLSLHPLVLPHLGCVEWICQVNGVGLFFHANDHRFAFGTQTTHKMYGRVIFELL
jgi:hypothetical protein